MQCLAEVLEDTPLSYKRDWLKVKSSLTLVTIRWPNNGRATWRRLLKRRPLPNSPLEMPYLRLILCHYARPLSSSPSSSPPVRPPSPNAWSRPHQTSSGPKFHLYYFGYYKHVFARSLFAFALHHTIAFILMRCASLVMLSPYCLLALMSAYFFLFKSPLVQVKNVLNFCKKTVILCIIN